MDELPVQDGVVILKSIQIFIKSKKTEKTKCLPAHTFRYNYQSHILGPYYDA